MGDSTARRYRGRRRFLVSDGFIRPLDLIEIGLMSAAEPMSSFKLAINGDVVNAPTRSSAIATRSMVIAGMIMVFVGLFQFFQSVASIANGQLFIVRSDDTFRLDPAAWGWIRVIFGIAVAIVGFGVLSAATWARYAGMGLAGLQAFNGFFIIPHYPAWALTTIGLDILVIWALAARRSATTRERRPRVDSLAK